MASTLKLTDLQHPSSGVSAITIGSDNSVSLGGGKISPQTGFKNRIINGDMRVSQRGTSFSLGAPSATFTVDRWYVFNDGAATTATKVDGIALPGFSSALSVSGASGNTAVSFGQRIESFNISDCAGSNVTISGYLYSSHSVAPNLYLGHPAATVDTFSSITNFSNTTLPTLTANTWTFFSVTVSLPANCSRGLLVNIQWGATGAGVARYLTGVQVEKGSVATPFEFRSIGQELVLCQRYFVSYGGDAIYERFSMLDCISTTAANGAISLPVQMRATPSLVTSALGNFAVYSRSSLSAISAITANFSSAKVFSWSIATTGLTQGSAGQFVANDSLNAKISLSAEL